MNIIVTGSLGHISQPLAKELIAEGHNITIISSKADRQKEIEALGAKAAIGSVEDLAFLTNVFTGADAVYGMTPPNYATTDIIAYYRGVATSYAEAIKTSSVKHIVYLSSYGADQQKGTGIIVGSHQSEAILKAMDGVAVTCLRPAYFYYNLYRFLGMIKSQGIIGSNYGGNDKLVMVSPIDIASAAAEELADTRPQSKVRYVVSDERSCNEVAGLIGAAIGKPGLQWLNFTDEQVKESLLQHGMSPHITELLVELGAAIHSGVLIADYEKQQPVFGKVKLQDFIKEFATAYRHQ